MNTLDLSNSFLNLSFCRESGALICIERKVDGAILTAESSASRISVLHGGDTHVPWKTPGFQVEGIEKTEGEVSLDEPELVDRGYGKAIRTMYRIGDWKIVLNCVLYDKLPVIGLDVIATFLGEGECTLQGVAWETPALKLADKTHPAWAAVDYFTWPFMVSNLTSGGTVLGWDGGRGDFKHVSVSEDGRMCANFDMKVQAASEQRNLAAGVHLGFSNENDASSAEVVRDWYYDEQYFALGDKPAWGVNPAIFETFIGTWPVAEDGTHYKPYPTTGDLVDDLPRIKQLGFDVIYLMPRQPFPSYSTVSLTDLGMQYGDGPGSEDQFKALVDAIHACGMKIIVDVVLHGVLDASALKVQARRRETTKGLPERTFWDDDWDRMELLFTGAWEEGVEEMHPYYAEHQEWFTHQPDGSCNYTYTRSFDLSNPGFQNFFVKSLTDLTLDPGIDGYRFDAPFWTVDCLQWSGKSSYRPSWVARGAQDLVGRLAREVQKIRPDTLFFMESCDPVFTRVAHLNYPYNAVELWNRCLKDGELSVAELRQGLSFLRKTTVPGTSTVHWMDSHDSAWWPPLDKKFKRQTYGLALARAWVSVLLLSGGPVMCFSGGEKELEDTYRKLLALRRADVVLENGTSDEVAVKCSSDSVFPVLRLHAEGWRIPVANLSDAVQEVELELPADLVSSPDVRDVRDLLGETTRLSATVGRKSTVISMVLQPYQVALLG